MANMAGIINKEVEPNVRDWLKSEFGQTFRETKLTIVTGTGHKVDAVSEDGTIAADILSNRAVTRGGKHNTGGVRKAENDFWKLANLTSSNVTTRMLIFTDDGFKAAFEKLIGDSTAVNISLRYCKLPPDIQRHLDKALDDASREQRSRNERREPKLRSPVCSESCPMFGKPVTTPRVCPVCAHEFTGRGWGGIDAHFRQETIPHESVAGVEYTEWFRSLCSVHHGKSK